jgi:hypothetical protein
LFITSPLEAIEVSAGMKMVLFLTRQFYNASILKKKKKKCGGGEHSKAMPNLLLPKAGRDKGDHQHTSQTQRTSVRPPNSRE